MPILSKVNRIRTQYDKAVRDALYMCQLIEIANGDASFEAVYPTIAWQDGIPKNALEEAQIMALRTGNKPNLDVKSAIKNQDSVDDEKADEIIRRIGEDEKNANGFVNPSVFNSANASNANNGGA
jgi:hypothetical protein